MSTRMHPQIVVTANTKEQLEKKTWRELAKWHKLARNGHWFKWTATKFYLKSAPETWYQFLANLTPGDSAPPLTATPAKPAPVVVCSGSKRKTYRPSAGKLWTTETPPRVPNGAPSTRSR